MRGTCTIVTLAYLTVSGLANAQIVHNGGFEANDAGWALSGNVGAGEPLRPAPILRRWVPRAACPPVYALCPTTNLRTSTGGQAASGTPLRRSAGRVADPKLYPRLSVNLSTPHLGRRLKPPRYTPRSSWAGRAYASGFPPSERPRLLIR